MKLSIHQNEHFTETEVIINCAYIDTRLQRLTDYIRQYTFSLECESEGKMYHLPIEEIYYIESVDSSVHFYFYKMSQIQADEINNIKRGGSHQTTSQKSYYSSLFSATLAALAATSAS